MSGYFYSLFFQIVPVKRQTNLGREDWHRVLIVGLNNTKDFEDIVIFFSKDSFKSKNRREFTDWIFAVVKVIVQEVWLGDDLSGIFDVDLKGVPSRVWKPPHG